MKVGSVMDCSILSIEELQEKLLGHYRKHYGECASDHFIESTARNVWVFEREGKVITLKCHMLTETVTEL